MVTIGTDHSVMDRSLMILENEHALLEDKQTACENLERYFNQLLQTKTELTPLKVQGIKVARLLLQYVEQEGENKLTIPALTALRPAVELIAKNVSFSAGMKLASLCYEALLKSYKICNTSCQAGILVEMFRCMSKFNDAQFFEAITSRKAAYAELKEVCESFMNPSASAKEMDLNQQAVRLEALRFLKRFLRVAGGAMITQIEQEMCYWVDFLLQHMFIFFKENDKVGYREMEVSIRQEAKEALELLLSKVTPGAQLRSEKWFHIKKDIRDIYAEIMVNMVGTCPEWSELWIVVLKLLDKELITKGNNNLINKLLNVEEKAFKFEADVRMQAFECWYHLIDKFIPDNCEHYRESVARSVRLLMQPLQANNARTEPLALQKLYTWWHLMHKLERCSDVAVTTVLSPFLTFCFGSPKYKDQCPGKKLRSLHLPSAQSLLFILDDRSEDNLDRKAEAIVLQSTKQKILPFKTPLLYSVGLFIHIAEELIYCIGECIVILSSGDYEDSKEIIPKMWQFLLSHMQKALKIPREENVKLVQNLLQLIRNLMERETSTSLLHEYYVNILLENMVKSPKALPTEVLSAPVYYVGNGPRFMAGTPALLLVECMMSPQLLPMVKSGTRYVSLMKYLINFGIEHCNTLDFIQGVLKKMESLNSNIEELGSMWKIVASACIKYLKSGGQVNQGGDNQHDFTCLYVVLMFPLQHICSIPYSEACEIVLVWRELYKLFCGVAKSTVTTLDVVEVQETVATKMNQILVKNSPKAAKEVIAILKATQDVVNSLPFSEVFGPQLQSKRRGRASCGISNVLNLVIKMSRLLKEFERVEEYFNTSWALLAIIIAVMYKNMKQINAVNALPIALQLSEAISAVLQVEVVHDGTSKFCCDSILRMWKDYLQFLETSLSKKSLKDAVSWLYLLEFGFKSTLLEVRTATIEFWDNYLYPLCHKEGVFISKELQELREKCGSTVARQSIIVADSEDDNASDIHLSNNEGKANKENICNLETVVKQTNDAVFAIPETVVKGKSKSLVQQLKDDGHVLTRHQKEILRSRKDDIPALYNSTLQPEQDSQYSQNSEGSQDTLEFTGPSRILEPVVEEVTPTPDRSLKVLEPPSSQRRLAEYRKKMMIDDEGSIILASVSITKEPASDLASAVTSSMKCSGEPDQENEVHDVALVSSENCSTSNNRKLNLESVAVPMLGTVVATNSSVSMPEVRLSISSPPAATDGSLPLEQASIENNVELNSERTLLMAANALQHLVKNANRDSLSESTVLLQNYVDFPPGKYMNTSKTNETHEPVTKLTNISAEDSSRSIQDEKENKSSVNYFKAVSIALVDDDEEEEEEEENDDMEMLNTLAESRCDNTATSDICKSLEQSNHEMGIQKANQGIQGDVKVVVEKVEDFSLNKTFAALETIASSSFGSTDLDHISPRASDICRPNRESTRRSKKKLKNESITKDPVELDLQKLFESPDGVDKHKLFTDEQKSSKQEAQSNSSRRPGRPRKNAKNSAIKDTTSPSLITGSKSKLKQDGKLPADTSKTNKFAHKAGNSNNKAENTREETVGKEEIVKENIPVSSTVELEAQLNRDADDSLLNSLSDHVFVPNVVSAECEGLVKAGDSTNNESDATAKSNISKYNSKDLKPSNAKKALVSHKRKEKPPMEKLKRKRKDSDVKENTEQKTKRPRQSKLPSKKISTGEMEVSSTNKDDADKSAGKSVSRDEPPLLDNSKSIPYVKSDTTIKDGHAEGSSIINSNEKHNFKESSTLEIGKSVLSTNTDAPQAGEEHTSENVPKTLNTRKTEKNSLPLTDNNSSLGLMAEKNIQAVNPNTNQKNDSSLKPKSKLSKKEGLVETAEKKGKEVPTARKLRSAKGPVPTSCRVEEPVKVSESRATESPRYQSTSDVENKDSSQIQKSKSNKPSKNEIDIGNALTKQKDEEPSESQDVVESSQSNPSPSIFSWSNLKNCTVVIKKLHTNLEPGTKVNIDENLVLIKTPNELSPYKVCTQLDSAASVIKKTDDKLSNSLEKVRKNIQNMADFSDVKLNSGSEVDEDIKSAPETTGDLNSSGTGKEKGAASKKCGSNSAGNKSKSSVSSNSELSVSETSDIKKVNPTKEIPQTKSKKAYIQTLITESISNASEKKEKHELTPIREGVKTRHQKIISDPSPKGEAQFREKTRPSGEETNKAKFQSSKLHTEETNEEISQKSKSEESNITKPLTSKSEERNKAKLQKSKSIENSITKTPTSKSEESCKAKLQTSKTIETKIAKTPTSKSEESLKAKLQTSKSVETNITKTLTSKSEESLKAKFQTSKSVETNITKTPTSKSEESLKAKLQTSKSVETNITKTPTSKSEESCKAKLQTSKTVETNVTKTPTSKSEDSNKAKLQTSKPTEPNEVKSQTSKTHKSNKIKSQTSESLTKESSNGKQSSKSQIEAISKAKRQSLKETVETKFDPIENIEKDRKCEEQGTNAHQLSVPKSQTKIHTPVKEVAVVQSCNTKSMLEVVDNSVHKETLKHQTATSEPSPPDSKMTSFVGEGATVKEKLSSVEIETASNKKINVQMPEEDALPIVSDIGSEKALNSKAQKAKSSVIMDCESGKERDGNGNASTSEKVGHVQIEVEAQLAETLKKSELEKTELKSHSSASETASIGIKENVQSFVSNKDFSKSRTRQLKTKLSNEGLVKSKRKQKLVAVSADDNVEKPIELATSNDTNLLNIGTSKMVSSNKISEESMPSDASDKEKNTTSESGETKETSVQTAKLRKNSLKLSNTESCLSNDTDANSESKSISKDVNSTVAQFVSGRKLDHTETLSKSDKVDEASTCNANQEDAAKDKASQKLFGEEVDRSQDSNSQDVTTGQEPAVAIVSCSPPEVEKLASNMQQRNKESHSTQEKGKKRRGRQPNLTAKRLFPLSRKRSLTKERPYNVLKNEIEASPKSPKMRKLFNTDGHTELIITPTHPESEAANTADAVSSPISSKSIPLPCSSPENNTSELPSKESSSVPVSSSGESLTPVVQTSVTNNDTSDSNKASPSMTSSPSKTNNSISNSNEATPSMTSSPSKTNNSISNSNEATPSMTSSPSKTNNSISNSNEATPSMTSSPSKTNNSISNSNEATPSMTSSPSKTNNSISNSNEATPSMTSSPSKTNNSISNTNEATPSMTSSPSKTNNSTSTSNQATPSVTASPSKATNSMSTSNQATPSMTSSPSKTTNSMSTSNQATPSMTSSPSITTNSMSTSNEASPSMTYAISNLAISSVTSCPLSVFSSETSPPKTPISKALSPKLSSPKSLLSSPSSLLKAFSSPSTSEPKQSRVGHHTTLAGRAQFMVGLALVSNEGKSASEPSARHDSTSATKIFPSSLTECPSAAVESFVEKPTADLTTPVKKRSLLMDPKRRLKNKNKRVSFSESPQTILYECDANEKKRLPFKSTKNASINSSDEQPPPKKARLRPEIDHDNSDDDIMIIHADSEAAAPSYMTGKGDDSPDLSGVLSQGLVQETLTELLSSQRPVFPQLSNCNHPIEAIVAQLANHPMWTKAFLNEMSQRNIRTIGDLSKCDELTISKLPIPVPKIAHTKKVLQDYLRSLSLLPKRGFWHSVDSRIVDQEGTPVLAGASSSSPANTENAMPHLNVTNCAKFIANNPKSLHAIIEEAFKIPHAQEKLTKEIESIREEFVGTANVGSAELLDKMAEYILSHKEQFLSKIPIVDLCKYLATCSPEEAEKWILECLCTYLKAGSFSFLDKLGSFDNSVDLLNIIQSYVMAKRPIADILEGMPKDSVLHFATSKLTLIDKMVMCTESLVTDSSPASSPLLEKLVNAILTKMKMSGALDLFSQIISNKLKAMDL